MSFSDLSRETRKLIWRALLCPPDGVRIHHSRERRRRNQEAGRTASKVYDNTEENKEQYEDEDEEDYEEKLYSCYPAAVNPVSTAIFYVSHQIRQEATEVFYSFNRFTFDSDAFTALKFLKSRPPSSRRQIKDIGFTRRVTCADDSGCTEYWDRLCTFISRHMHVNSATIQVPRDINHGIDETREARQAPDPEWYWWPAARLMRGLLMAGNVQKLRLGYSATLKIHAPEEESQHRDSAQSPRKDPLEELKAVSYLRYPRPQKEQDREYDEIKALTRDVKEGRAQRFTSLIALEAEQEKRRQRFDFVVAREDDPVGDVGTVLVLCRPAAS